MDTRQFEKYNQISADKFAFANKDTKLHDLKLDTKPVGFFRDAFNRFKKNKASVVGAIIILILIVYAIIGPFCFDADYQAAYSTDNDLKKYQQLPPRISFMQGTGFWDGSKVKEYTEVQMYRLKGMYEEIGYNPVIKELGSEVIHDQFLGDKVVYKVRVDEYYLKGVFTKTLTAAQYKDIQEWQSKPENQGLQVILPAVDTKLCPIYTVGGDALNYWFECDKKGRPNLDADGNFKPAYVHVKYAGEDAYNSTRLANDPGTWSYAKVGGSDAAPNYVVRLSAYNYFIYKFGYEPAFFFGTDNSGYDIFTRLASGARFSLILAVVVSAINLTIGAIYGAIEGYFGGVVDMTMERISDILSGIPSTVVTILFQLHLAAKVGVVGALLFAFVMTGWIGMASRVRMQFYRFKNQEYVLAARTLGATDWRIIWKHIFPNTLGTLITGSVLVIPGVIFSETSLSYLGIINLDSATMSSVGTMLSEGQKVMTTAPHVVLFPAIFIALLMISFNIFGNGLRDAFNPSLRGTED